MVATKGHTYLNKPAAFKLEVCLSMYYLFSPPGIKGLSIISTRDHFQRFESAVFEAIYEPAQNAEFRLSGMKLESSDNHGATSNAHVQFIIQNDS